MATITKATGFILNGDDAARTVLNDDATWLGDVLEDNGGEPDGSAWIIFPVEDDADRAEIARLGVRGQYVEGYLVGDYDVDGHLSDYAASWAGNQKLRRAFFTDEDDARRCADALVGNVVGLYEDGAGNLYLARDGAGTAYDVTDLQEQASFEQDAVALLNGDTGDWTVEAFDVTEAFLAESSTKRVAEYDGVTGAVRVTSADEHMHELDAIPDDGIRAGHAGRTYIGPLRYASDEEEM